MIFSFWDTGRTFKYTVVYEDAKHQQRYPYNQMELDHSSVNSALPMIQDFFTEIHIVLVEIFPAQY